MLELTHGDRWAGDGRWLGVAVHRRQPIVDHDLRLELARNLWRRAGFEDRSAVPGAVQQWVAEREVALAAGELGWAEVQVAVDGAVQQFALLREGEHWVAHASVGTVDVILHGRRFPLSDVELVRLRSLDRYLPTRR
jgi:hypothetical protein